MGANATSVAARVPGYHRPTAFRHLKPILARLAVALDGRIAVVLALAAIPLIAAGPSLLDDGRERREAVAAIAGALDVLANLVAHEAAAIGVEATRTADGLDRLIDALPTGALLAGRSLLVADEHDHVVGMTPPAERTPRRLSDLLGGARPSDLTPDQPWLLEATLPGGGRVLATIRPIPAGHIAVLQPKPAEGAGWGWASPAALAGASLLLLLGAGCLQLAKRARSAHLSCLRTRTRLETALARGRCGLWDWDIERGTMFWSASMYEMLGYEPRAECLSVGEISAITRAPEGELRDLLLESASSDRGHVDHEFRARTATGAWLWLRLRAEVVLDPEDGQRHLVGVAVDVTDERMSAERTATADARLREALEAISEGFVLWDAEQRLVLCNSKFQQLHELPPALVVPGASYAAVIEAARASIVENRLASGYPQHPNARTIDKQLADGRWIHINERRTRDGGFVSVGTDITPLKQKEEKLLASERRLTASVRELKQSRKVLQIQAQRLAELAERNHEERARAELASLAKTEFLAKMSHELRTPLNAIIGFADMMRSEVLGPLGCERYGEYTGHIHASGLQLLSAIDHILQMSRLDAGGVEIAREPLSVLALGRTCLDAVAREADSKGLSLALDVGPSTVVIGDAAALRESLVQLLRNAVRFTGAGGSVRLRARPAGEAVNIFVEDSGSGIPAAFLARIGRPFEGVECEYNRSQCGSGLGLAIARALVGLHDGALRIRSQEGLGTIALVHLPGRAGVANDLSGPLGQPKRSRPYLVAAE